MPSAAAHPRTETARERAAAAAAVHSRRQELINLFAEMRRENSDLSAAPPQLPPPSKLVAPSRSAGTEMRNRAGIDAATTATAAVPPSPGGGIRERRSRQMRGGGRAGGASSTNRKGFGPSLSGAGGGGRHAGQMQTPVASMSATASANTLANRNSSNNITTSSPAAAAVTHGHHGDVGAIFTRSGRPVILSATSRRLPRAFDEQKQVVQAIETTISNVNMTLKSLTYDLSRASDIQLPPATLAAVEDNHRTFTDALALRSGAGAHGKDGLVGVTGQGLLSLPYTLRGKNATPDWLMRLQRARAAAADECISDMHSVADYASEPFVGRAAKDQTLRDELNAMRGSLEKIEACGAAMRVDVSGNSRDRLIPGSASTLSGATSEENAGTQVESAAAQPCSPAAMNNTVPATNGSGSNSAALGVMPLRLSNGDEAVQAAFGPTGIPWWSSALRTRDLKAHAIRLNYHARKALQWNWRSREHLLLQSTHLNHSSIRCRDDFVRLQGKLQSFAQRQEDSELMTHSLQEEALRLQEELAEVNERRAEMQERLVVAARDKNLLDERDNDPLNAELALLLDSYSWPSELKADVDTVLAWLRAEPTALE